MKKITIILAILIVASITTNAQWQPTSLYEQINCLAVNGTNIFAGTTISAVNLSTDEGINWNPVNNGIPIDNIVTSLAISGSNIFAGVLDWQTFHGGMYLSSNNGTSWTAINIGLPNNTYFTAIAASGTDIFATDGNVVYLSSDTGATWNSANTGFPIYIIIDCFAVSGTNIFAGTSDGVYISSNNGANWTAINTGLPNNTHVTAIAVSGTNIFAGTQDVGAYLSSNNGASWTSINTGLTIFSSIESLAVSATNVFAGTQNGVFKYSLCTPPSSQATAFASSVITDSTMTINWMRGNGDSVLVVARDEFAIETYPYSGSTYIANSAFGSGDQIGSDNYVVYKGVDTSVNITDLTSGTTYHYAIYEYDGTSYCYNSPALGGIATTTGMPPCTPGNIVTQPNNQTSCTPSNSTSFTVAATSTGTITYQWQYNNDGTWESVTNGTPAGATYTNGTYSSMTVSGITVADAHQYRCNLTYCIGINDFSYTALLIVNTTPITPIITLAGNTLISNAPIGNQWYNLSTGIINGANAQSYNPLQIGSYYTIVTLNSCLSDSSNNIYYNNVGIAENTTNVFSVKVFPNPFTDKTTIEYMLTKTENVELSVVDITGKELIKLKNEKQNKGIQNVDIEASKISNGIYFYNLKIGDKLQKGKLIKY